MKCNNCGAKSENESFCNYCGTLFEASINEKAWSNTTEKNDQLTNYLVLALSAQETSNYPEAISYYNKALELDSKLSEAWFGKGYCAGWSGSLASIKIGEMASCFKKAIQSEHDSAKEELTIRISNSITNNALATYKLSYNHTVNHAGVKGVYEEHLNRVINVLENLQWAYELNPESMNAVNIICDISEQLMVSISYDVGHGKDKKAAVHTLSSESMDKVNATRVKYSKILMDNDPSYANKLKTDLKGLKNWSIFWLLWAGLGAILPFLFLGYSAAAFVTSMFMVLIGAVGLSKNSKERKKILEVLS